MKLERKINNLITLFNKKQYDKVIFETESNFDDKEINSQVLLILGLARFKSRNRKFNDVLLAIQNFKKGYILEKKSNTINQADILLRYDNGISSICQSSWYSPAKVRDVEIMTSSKIIKASYLDSSIRILEFDNKEYSYIVEKEDALNLEVINFLECISSGTKPKVSFEDAFRAVEIAKRAEQIILDDARN